MGGRWKSACHCRLPLDEIRRIVVVGAGKAGAGMAEAVEKALGPQLMAEKQLTGWVNVPADCVRPLQRIHLHAARPAGVNEPTPEGVAGALEILRLVASLGPDDLCLCLLSGGGSALMPAPVEGISLADKLAVTRHLSAAGANIEQLNTVRKQLSRIKGGGLLRACRAGRLVSLIISDVLGDPLEIIASGPTVPDSSTPQEALDVLDRFDARAAGISPAVFAYLRQAALAQCEPFSRRVHAAQSPAWTPGLNRGHQSHHRQQCHRRGRRGQRSPAARLLGGHRERDAIGRTGRGDWSPLAERARENARRPAGRRVWSAAASRW